MNTKMIMFLLILSSLNTYSRPTDEEMAAIKTCEEELNITRPKRHRHGERPSQEEHEQMKINMEKLKSCLSKKGIELPKRRHSRRRNSKMQQDD